MRIGLDIHGVVDSAPPFFAEFTKLFIAAGHEIHIITGAEQGDTILDNLNRWGINFTHFFSIATYHKKNGIAMRYDEKGTPWMDEQLWRKTKAEYCKTVGIDYHFDDSDVYHLFFETPYFQFKCQRVN